MHEQIRQLLKKRYSSSAEKISADQLGLFNEAEEAIVEENVVESETTTVKSYARTRKPRVSIPDNLPREEIIHDIAESEKVCPHEGAAPENIGSEDHEQLGIVPPR